MFHKMYHKVLPKNIGVRIVPFPRGEYSRPERSIYGRSDMTPKAMVVEMDPEARALMERVREAIIERNRERASEGNFEAERATYKSIIQRGIAALAREVLTEI